ncbi:MAG: sigma-70 family RNA polymerase sigma factor [Vicinamibacterales bacterium]
MNTVHEPQIPERTMAVDADLVARLKAGDPDAFETMVRTMGGRMLSVARRMLGDEEAARDAVQDAFLSAVRSLHGFDGHSQLATWLHRIVVNAALMKIRTRQRRPEYPLDALLPTFADDGHHAEPVSSWGESPERLLEQQETRAVVRAAIATLPPSYRAALLLRDIEGLSTHEAAVALGITGNALKLRLHRARQALTTLLRARLGGGQATAVRPAALRMGAVPVRVAGMGPALTA